MKKIYIFILLLFILNCSIFDKTPLIAEESTSIRLVMFSPGDDILHDLRILVMETGLVFMSYTPPISNYEIINYLSGIKEENLSITAKEIYNRIKQKLSPVTFYSSGAAAVSLGMIINTEFSVRTNNNVNWVLPDLDRPDFIRIPVDLYLMNFVQLHFEESYRNFPGERFERNYINTNIPYRFDYLDGSGRPFRAFAALGNNWWNIQIGRDRLSLGSAHTGNLLLSDTPDYQDFARFSVFGTWIKYSMILSQIPIFFDQSFVDISIVNFDEYPGLQTNSLNRYSYIHRLDLLLGNKFSIGFTEQMITGDSPIQLRYLNPMMFMHNYFSGYDYQNWGNDSLGLMDNMLFSINFQWIPVSNLSFYGQWIIDALNLFVADSQEPNGLGYLAGIEYYHTFKNFSALFFTEFVYTDPYLYVDNSPFGASIWFRRMVANPVSYFRYKWIGHPNGRDAITFVFGSHLSFNEKLSVEADIRYIVQGEHDLVWDWSLGEQYKAEKTPTGRPQHAISIFNKFKYKLTKNILLHASLANSIVINANHSDITLYGMEFSFGAKFSGFLQPFWLFKPKM